MSITETAVVEYPTTPLMLEKPIKRHNILVGDDALQIKFAEQILSAKYQTKIECKSQEIVNDSHILGHEDPQLYRVDRLSQIDMSPHTKPKVGIWAMDFIEKGSAGANAIVREASRLIGGTKPDRKTVEYISSEITKHLYDIKSAIWYATWLLTGETPEKRKWLGPWESHISWLPRGEDVSYRLNTLYWELVEYVFAAENDEKGFKKTGRTFRPKEFKYLASLTLPKDRVIKSLTTLSSWREYRTDPYICALKISSIWQRK